MKKLIAIVSLLLTLTPVMATEINTVFYNDGFVSSFHEMTVINGGSEGIIEEITAWGPHELTVVKNADFTYHHRWDYVSLNEDKEIFYDGDPHTIGDLSVVKSIWWGAEQLGGADVYREAVIGDDIYDVTHAGGIGTGMFVDSIETNKDTYIYQSVGLDQFATCEYPDPPEPPEKPDCSWCGD